MFCRTALTGGGAEKWFASYSSTDLINWKFEVYVYYGNNENGWGTGDEFVLTGVVKIISAKNSNFK